MGGQDKRGGHPKYGDLIVELTVFTKGGKLLEIASATTFAFPGMYLMVGMIDSKYPCFNHLVCVLDKLVWLMNVVAGD